jgi:hypothetical protein
VPGNLGTVAVDTGYEIQIDEEARGDTRLGEGDGFSFNRTDAIYKVPIGNGVANRNIQTSSVWPPGFGRVTR